LGALMMLVWEVRAPRRIAAKQMSWHWR
jgi:hypothetical protein